MAMKDQISALVDGELSLDNSEHLFTAVKAGGESAECWSVYHLIGDAMRGNPVFTAAFQQRIMDRIKDEVFILAPQILAPQAEKPFMKTPAIWSMAASVAAVMFVGWMVMQQQAQQGADIAPLEIAQNLPSEYLLAHQSSAPSGAGYYIQPAGYSESGK
jgi:sigma-E factor negative regulatory protein RseA